jgi:pseudouridine-5'-monophosphatase
MSSRTKITHVIFDLDGLLIDTESIFSAINIKLLAKYNRELTYELEHKLMGTRTDESVQMLLSETGLKGLLTAEEYLSAFQSELEYELPRVKEMPGASQLIDYFYEKNIPLAICSGSNPEEFRTKTENFQNWLNKMPIKVLGTDVKYCKPAPDSYLLTMERFECPPAHAKHTLVFEDAINGARSSINAGATTILVSKHIDKMRNSGQLDDILPSLAETLPSLTQFDPSKYEFCLI